MYRVYKAALLDKAADVMIEFWNHPLQVFKSQADSNPVSFHPETADGLYAFLGPLLALRLCDRIIFNITSL